MKLLPVSLRGVTFLYVLRLFVSRYLGGFALLCFALLWLGLRVFPLDMALDLSSTTWFVLLRLFLNSCGWGLWVKNKNCLTSLCRKHRNPGRVT
jgi:hypothetical protein